jgi:hypothetical protein
MYLRHVALCLRVGIALVRSVTRLDETRYRRVLLEKISVDLETFTSTLQNVLVSLLPSTAASVGQLGKQLDHHHSAGS